MASLKNSAYSLVVAIYKKIFEGLFPTCAVVGEHTGLLKVNYNPCTYVRLPTLALCIL